MRKVASLPTALFGVALLCGSSAWATNIVSKSGFEADNASGGAVTPPTDWAVSGMAGVEQGFSHSRDNAEYLGNGTLSQDLSAVVATTFQVSFWVGINDATTLEDPNTTFGASLGGEDLLGGAMPPEPPFPGSFIQCPNMGSPCHQKTMDSFTATSTTTTLSFTRVISIPGEFWFVDDVSVTPQESTSMPKSTTLALVGVGFLRIRIVRRRTA
jgi:hypothetical protein